MLNNNKKKDKNKRAASLAILLLLIAAFILLVVGMVAAFYSDKISKSADMGTGTLDISGSYTITLNGQEKSFEEIRTLAPGDVMVIACNIENLGNKSAWIRETFMFDNAATMFPYMNVYEGSWAQEAIMGGECTDKLLTFDNNKAVSANAVINGSGTDAEVISEGSYNLIGAANYVKYYTIYFSHEAGNDTQGLSFNLSITTEALQYTNNNLTEPTDAAWMTVAALN